MLDVQNFLLFQLFQLVEWADEPPGINSSGRTAGLRQDRNGTNLILEPQVDERDFRLPSVFFKT